MTQVVSFFISRVRKLNYTFSQDISIYDSISVFINIFLVMVFKISGFFSIFAKIIYRLYIKHKFKKLYNPCLY